MTADPVLTAAVSAPAAPPVFGRRADSPQAGKTRTFGIEVSHRDRGKMVAEDVMLTAYTDLDAGAVLRLMQARDELEQVNATAFVLSTCLVDDDGVPSDWSTPAVDEPALTDPDDEESEPERGEPTDEEPDGELLYERWDGELVPWEELSFDEFTDGSSRRRFAYIMTTPRYRVIGSALVDTAKWLIQEAGGRPTKRPTPSGRGPQSTHRGSAARRH